MGLQLDALAPPALDTGSTSAPRPRPRPRPTPSRRRRPRTSPRRSRRRPSTRHVHLVDHHLPEGPSTGGCGHRRHRQPDRMERPAGSKALPAPDLLTPRTAQRSAPDYTLSWAPLAFAKTYESRSTPPATRAVTTTRTRLVGASDPFPVSHRPYTWRVRRVDAKPAAPASGRDCAPSAWKVSRRPSPPRPPSEWSAHGRPALSWQPDPRATSYSSSVASPGRRPTVAETVPTRARRGRRRTAMPAGTAQWRVTALDATGKDLGASPWRDVRRGRPARRRYPGHDLRKRQGRQRAAASPRRPSTRWPRRRRTSG